MTVNYKRKKNCVTGKGSKANKNSVEINLKHMKRLFFIHFLVKSCNESIVKHAHKALMAFFNDGVAKSIGLRFQYLRKYSTLPL